MKRNKKMSTYDLLGSASARLPHSLTSNYIAQQKVADKLQRALEKQTKELAKSVHMIDSSGWVVVGMDFAELERRVAEILRENN